MILVGNQRGGGRDLARHLLKDDNERVVVHDMRGFASNDLHSAFQESYAISRGTKCKQHLFSLSLNPPQDAKARTEDFEDAVNRAEKALGLEGQPRAIVFHEKIGEDGQMRRHAHSVWCRIDIENMRAVQLSFTKTKLQEVARDFYLDHGWKMPRGFVRHEERDPRNFTLQEWQQCKRVKRDPTKMKEVFQDAWSISDGKTGFANALKAHGLILARGDRRGHVAVDHNGEAYAVSRYTGLKAKQVRDRLGQPDDLPSKIEAHRVAAQRVTDRLLELQEEQHQAAKQKLERLRTDQQAARNSRQAETQRLEGRQTERSLAEQAARDARVRTGVRGLFDWVTGKRKQIKAQNQIEAENAKRRDESERAKLKAAHEAHRKKQIQSAGSASVERKSTKKELEQDIKVLTAVQPEKKERREVYRKRR